MGGKRKGRKKEKNAMQSVSRAHLVSSIHRSKSRLFLSVISSFSQLRKGPHPPERLAKLLVLCCVLRKNLSATNSWGLSSGLYCKVGRELDTFLLLSTRLRPSAKVRDTDWIVWPGPQGLKPPAPDDLTSPTAKKDDPGPLAKSKVTSLKDSYGH